MSPFGPNTSIAKFEVESRFASKDSQCFIVHAHSVVFDIAKEMSVEVLLSVKQEICFKF